MYSYGIDLGTTYSCIARVDERGNVEVLKNMEGSYTTPSIVEFSGPNTVIVGDDAKEDIKLDPENVCLFIKRSMGKNTERREYHGKAYTPEEISARILMKLVRDAETLTGDTIKDVVITIPAYFGISERQATQNAGKIAGLNVLALANEPTAAAIAYTRMRSSLDNKTVLVYDLGGGTFDVTVADISAGQITIVATNGNHSLGGKDWDAELVDFFINQYCAETGAESSEIYDDSEAFYDFLLKAEEAKKKLTNKNSETIVIDRGPGKRAKLKVTIDEFNEITKHLLLSTMQLTKEVLRQAAHKRSLTGEDGFSGPPFHEIIFVGGSTRMRQVREAVKEEFGIEPQMFEPDEAVARGAAFMAAQYLFPHADSGGVELTGPPEDHHIRKPSDKRPTKNVVFGEDVISKSYGIKAKIGGVPRISHVIIKNDILPCSKTKTYKADATNQSYIEIEVYESNIMESWTDLSYGQLITIGKLHLPAGLPKGTHIDVTFSFDNNGMLDISATERSQGAECSITIKTDGLQDEDVSRMREESKNVKMISS